MKIRKLEQAGKRAIELLRFNKLKHGMPFMINTPLLPSHQCYLEYPNGSISIVTICKTTKDFKVLHILSEEENQAIRKKLNLSVLE